MLIVKETQERSEYIRPEVSVFDFQAEKGFAITSANLIEELEESEDNDDSDSFF